MNGETVEQTALTLTEKAIKEIKRIKQESSIPEEHGLRIGVKGGGCSGLSYTMGFDSVAKDTDTIIKNENIDLYIDGKSLFYLSGTVLDFSDGLNGRGFVFTNPNAKKTCGCGSSFGT